MKVEECITSNELRQGASPSPLWESIIVDATLKERLRRSAILALRLRPVLPFTTTALHGLVLLYGPPGTGKTTLARGLADELGAVHPGGVRLVEVNPHGLMSAEHGQSQQLVTQLLCEHIPALAADGRATVILLDEVESMAVARSAASLSANPADVHRATDAVLTALDRNTTDHHHIVTVATSNFDKALDEAFKSRADESILVPLPSADGIVAILRATLQGFGAVFPGVGALAGANELSVIAHRLEGLDGRRVRKVVTDAMKMRSETVLDPNLLSIEDLAAAATRAGIEGGANAAA
ncbi:MAG: AAA family ATPase [Actinomycetota bacterium]|nr:AAA family ATPase [Actinomycetota bacterium]